MPPRIRTRAARATKVIKDIENIENKLKSINRKSKTVRKALADKTNSASDENSLEGPIKPKGKVNISLVDEDRPRRNRRIPERFVKAFEQISKSIEATVTVPHQKSEDVLKQINASKRNTPVKALEVEEEVSPFKTPSKLDTSLLLNRPRRMCRLPSRFDDHFLSPSKVATSSPHAEMKSKQVIETKKVTDKSQNAEKPLEKSRLEDTKKTKGKKKPIAKQVASSSPDYNEKTPQEVVTRVTRNRQNAGKVVNKNQPMQKLDDKKKTKGKPKQTEVSNTSIITKSPQLKKITYNPENASKLVTKSPSFQVLGQKKKSKVNENKDVDIYEFTFDPSEEPPPRKKKRKKPTVTKQGVPKLKTVVTHKSTYDQNISKTLSALKNAVSKKVQGNKVPQIQNSHEDIAKPTKQNIVMSNTNTVQEKDHVSNTNDASKASVFEGNYPSIRIEDIAADIEPSIEHNDFNYSPVNSPRAENSVEKVPEQQNPIANPKDPLNLQGDISFFDDIPVASSSMNKSVRHPLASPWRVEFGSLPIKWHSNTYVKANMTPAVESSFICSEDSNKKKHVYTNMVVETNESLPQIVSSTPTLKQPSIISFIKEVAEKKAKKKMISSLTPSKADKSDNQVHIATTTTETSVNNISSDNVSSGIDTSNEKENCKENNKKNKKRKNNENVCDIPAKSPRNQKDKEFSYFGFNESEDQENISPRKENDNLGRALRPRVRPVLQEFNGPIRAALPVAAKSKIVTSSDAVNKVYEQLKSAADAPVFPDNVEINETNIEDRSDDSQSVHLFEDIDVVHHLKPTRKSYGKAKKVAFCKQSDGNSIEGTVQQHEESSFEDDFGDLTFEVPDVKEKRKVKKKRPKNLMSKKEEKEAAEWAAGFNSMCEEIEEFQLMVE